MDALVEQSVIELGERRGEPPPVPARRPAPRSWAVAAAAVVALLVPAGSAVPPAAPEPVRVPAPAAAALDVYGETLYVTAFRAADSLTQTVTAYALPRGRRLWQATLPSDTFIEHQGMLLVPTYDEGTGALGLVAVDGGTGATLWRRDGMLVAVPGDPTPAEPLLMAVLAAGADAGGGVDAERVDAVDPRTGRTHWSYALPPGARPLADRQWRTPAARLVVILPSGRAELRELSSGRLLAAATVVPPPAESTGERGPGYALDGDLALFAGADRRTLTAYSLGRLERLWSVDAGGIEALAAEDCGFGLLCAPGDEAGATTVALSRDTGRVRWRASVEIPVPVGGLLLAHAAVPADGSAPLVGGPPTVLLDPATGAVRHRLGDWDMIAHTGGGPAYLVHLDPATYRAWFAVLEPGATRTRLLGTATGVRGDCRVTASGSAFACRRRDGSIGVWPVG